ncbi:Plasmodium variant antigen protein Cir/Yir/Bir, putative, partial [Plasmodium chabaudi chabaudi]
MSKELCEQIDEIEKYVVFDSTSEKYKFNDEILNAYCHNKKCENDELKLGSAFMALLNNFKSIEDEKIEDVKLNQYAVLWLSYKIKQNPNIEFIRSTIYDILKQNEWYRELSKSADDKENTMGFHFIYLTNLYKFLKGICETINKCSDSSNPEECKQYGEKCSDLYRACIMQFPWAEICNPYCNVLTNLKNDYDKLKEKYSLPELKLPQGLSDCNGECLKLNNRYKDIVDAHNRSIGGSKKVPTLQNSLPGPS